MNRNQIKKDYLQEFSRAGISLDEQLVKFSWEESLDSGTKLLTLLLDGQRGILQPGRFAYLEVNSRQQLMSFGVFERLTNQECRVVITRE